MVRKSDVLSAVNAQRLGKRERVAVVRYAEQNGKRYNNVQDLISDALD